jgi:hypothetical protein
MNKKIDVKKKEGRGNQRHHRVSCPQVPVAFMCKLIILFILFHNNHLILLKVSLKNIRKYLL